MMRPHLLLAAATLASVALSGAASAATLVVNPGFATDLSGWEILHGRPAVWDSDDAAGSPTSGSARISNLSNPSNGAVSLVLKQCFAATPGEQYRISASIRVPPGQPAGTFGYAFIYVTPDAGCFGDPLDTRDVHSGSANWQRLAEGMTAPAGAAGVAVMLGVFKPLGETAPADVLFDNVELASGPFVIDHTISGSWFNSAWPGQGFFIDVAPSLNLFFAGWYTWTDVVGQQRWLTAQGDYSADTALVPIIRTQGGQHNSPAPVTNEIVGWAEFRFLSCTEGKVDIDLAGQPPATIPLTRLTPPLPGCGE